MIYGNMNKEAGSSQGTGLVKKIRPKISDLFSKTERHSFEGQFWLSMLYLTYGEMKAYYYVSASHVIYMIIIFVQLKSFYQNLHTCKKSCQPIADKLTDIQARKSTAEQPHNPTVPTQPLEAEDSASPSQSSIDIHLHITEPFQPTNFTFSKKTFGKQNRSFQAKWFTDFPWLHYNEQSDYVVCFI